MQSSCLSLPMVAAQQMVRGCFVGRSHNAFRREVLAGGSHVLGGNVEDPREMHDFMCHDQPNFILHSCICNPAAPCAPRSCEQSKAAKPTHPQPSHQLMGSATYRLLLYLMVLDFSSPIFARSPNSDHPNNTVVCAVAIQLTPSSFSSCKQGNILTGSFSTVIIAYC